MRGVSFTTFPNLYLAAVIFSSVTIIIKKTHKIIFMCLRSCLCMCKKLPPQGVCFILFCLRRFSTPRGSNKNFFCSSSSSQLIAVWYAFHIVIISFLGGVQVLILRYEIIISSLWIFYSYIVIMTSVKALKEVLISFAMYLLFIIYTNYKKW